MTLFHSVFLSLAISLKQLYRNVLQNFAKDKRQQAAIYRERSSSKVISCEIYEIFQSSFFLEQLSVNVSFSRVGLAQPYQNFKYLILLTKQICTSYK